MRKYLVAFLFLFFTNAFAATAKTNVVQIQRWKTTAGSNVYFVKISTLPMLDIRTIFAAGSVYDDKTPGLASFVSSMIGESTKTQTAEQIAKTFDAVGAQFSTSADRDKSSLLLRSLVDPKYLDVALKEYINVMADMSPSVRALTRVRNQTLATIKVNQQDPDYVAQTAFYKMIYDKQPYGHGPLGTFSSVNSISRDDLSHFYSQYYVAENADIVLVGDVTLKHAKQIANQISRALPRGQKAKRLKLATSLDNNAHRHIQFPAKQTAIFLGQVGITRRNPDYFPLIVGNYIFGVLPLDSVLFQRVRDQKGLAYFAGSTFEMLRYRGPFIIQLNTRANKANEALSIVRSSLDNFVLSGPTMAQLNMAKQSLIGSFPLALSSNGDIAQIVSNMAFYQVPLDYLDTYQSKVQAVTLQQIKLAFSKVIHPKRLAVVTVGPSA